MATAAAAAAEACGSGGSRRLVLQQDALCVQYMLLLFRFYIPSDTLKGAGGGKPQRY